jgi:hypothetical protein
LALEVGGYMPFMSVSRMARSFSSRRHSLSGQAHSVTPIESGVDVNMKLIDD